MNISILEAAIQMNISILEAAIQSEKEAEKIADSIVACLGDNPDSYMLHMQLPKILGKKLMPAFQYSTDDRFPLLEGLLDGHVQEHLCPRITKALDTLWKYQEDKEKGYGDADYFFKKYKLTEKVRVSVIKNVATCSDENQFIVVENLENHNIHVRVIVDDKKSDYPRKLYPKKLCLRFFRDRDFIVDFVEKFQGTNKGGVYGDERDVGYVISYNRLKTDVKNSLYFMSRLASFSMNLFWMADEYLEVEKVDNIPGEKLPLHMGTLETEIGRKRFNERLKSL